MQKILLVDDMRQFLDLTQSFLSRAECQLLTANTGLEAIKVAKSSRPDLIVLDIEMPEMTGIEACRILKADPGLRHIPIVMLTSLSKEDEARRAGADHFLKKPIDEDSFLAEIRKFLPFVERQERRFPVDLEADARHDADPPIAVRVTDLSKSGAFVAGLLPEPQIAEQVVLAIRIPDGAGGTHIITPRAVVVRRVPSRGAGIRFLDLSSGAKILLEEFLDSLEER
jgi:CheY-like chemotaxis protein